MPRRQTRQDRSPYRGGNKKNRRGIAGSLYGVSIGADPLALLGMTRGRRLEAPRDGTRALRNDRLFSGRCEAEAMNVYTAFVTVHIDDCRLVCSFQILCRDVNCLVHCLRTGGNDLILTEDFRP